MGSAMSRCTTKNTHATPGFSEASQRFLEKQPNWLVPPSRWRSRSSTHHSPRYRTPTPYPKDDRQKVTEDDIINISEKAAIIDTTHIEVAEAPLRRGCRQQQHKYKPLQSQPLPQSHPAAVTITWDRHPRQNRFDRIS
ncbi:hypothetical protein B0T17DRAFT_124388 [Bombardia bombarda]|uniref:Uncharacterized protein n=1 Tax=Bombardia bombarda TaxID=252184 RepID=A0AA39U340_9PEZI|nr:hypothetical protein B0T17DRAFT_124388 [Bombardia bombarda]